MKKLVKFGILLSLMTSGFSAAYGKVVVGMVDFQKVLLSVEEGKAVRTKLEDFFKQKQNLLKKEEDKFKDLQQKFEKQKSVMNEAAKTAKDKELRELYISIQEQTMGYQKELQEMENNLKKPIIDKIKSVSEQVSKSSGVNLTFEAASTPLIYAEEQKELTEEVISAYNKKFPKK
jgi:outer membrane protein